MATSTTSTPSGRAHRTDKAPIHLWIVGIVSLLWNAFGADDYLMTQLQVEAYMSQFTEEQLAYFNSFPSWAVAVWALGVWGALSGSVLLLMRSRWAVAAFAISIFGLMISTVYTHVLSEGASAMGDVAQIMSLAIWVIAIALLVYAWKQAARGVLR